MQETEADHAVFPSEVVSGLLLDNSVSFFESKDNIFLCSKIRIVSYVWLIFFSYF